MHVLVATDRSDESWNALDHALDTAELQDGAVTIVHVVEENDTDDRDAGQQILKEASERSRSRSVPLETRLLDGDPVESIAATATEGDFDVLYVGHRGLTGEQQELSDDDRSELATEERAELSGDGSGELGSVAKGLLERTDVPVAVFDRPPESDP